MSYIGDDYGNHLCGSQISSDEIPSECHVFENPECNKKP